MNFDWQADFRQPRLEPKEQAKLVDVTHHLYPITSQKGFLITDSMNCGMKAPPQ